VWFKTPPHRDAFGHHSTYRNKTEGLLSWVGYKVWSSNVVKGYYCKGNSIWAMFCLTPRPHEPRGKRLTYQTIRRLDGLQRRSALRTAFFCDIKQRIVVLPYRRLGRTYRSHLQGSSNPCYFFLDFFTLKDATDIVISRPGSSRELIVDVVLERVRSSFTS